VRYAVADTFAGGVYGRLAARVFELIRILHRDAWRLPGRLVE
jgi:hypothetical protein